MVVAGPMAGPRIAIDSSALRVPAQVISTAKATNFANALIGRTMRQSEYYLKIGRKTQFLNVFRQVFRLRPLEGILVRIVKDLNVDSSLKRIVPPNYLYPPNSRRAVERDGIRYDLDISDYVEHAVYFGSRDKSQEQLTELAKGRNIIIDVGVNIGSVSLRLANASPDGYIFGFEPDRKNFEKARHNVELNGVKNISLINRGLGAERSTAKLFTVNKSNNGMNRILQESNQTTPETDYCEIEIIRLDDFVVEEALDRIDLIKIDVEGYELRVLEGGVRSLRKFTPDLFIELDDNFLREQGDSARELVLFLERLDYCIYSADSGVVVTSSDDFGGCHFDIVCRKRVSAMAR